MTKFSLVAALTAATVLAACQPMPVTDPPAADDCGAASYQGLVGQPRTTLAQMTFPIGTRIIGPDDAVTADFLPERLNIEYGRNGRIDKISCY